MSIQEGLEADGGWKTGEGEGSEDPAQLRVKMCEEGPSALSHAILLASSALDLSAACSPSSIGPSLTFTCPPACYPKHWLLPVEVGPAYTCFLLGLQTPYPPP